MKTFNPDIPNLEKKQTSTGTSRREFLKTTLAAGAALSVSSLGLPVISHAKADLKIGYLPIFDHLSLLVSHARDNNSFSKVSVTPTMFKSWNSIAGALKANVLDGAFLLANFAIDQFNKGLDIKTILVGHRHGSGLTVRKNSNLTSPGDLKGKTVAIPADISTHTALLNLYLKQAGLSLNDVTTRVIAPPSMAAALKDGSIDAFIVAEPFCEKTQLAGFGHISVLSKDIMADHMCCIVVIRDDVLKAKREGIQEWVNSLVRSGRFIEEDKAAGAMKVADISAKYLKKHSKKEVVNVLRNPIDRITYGDLEPRLADYQKILDISVQAGFMGSLDLTPFVDDSFFKNVQV
jgi:NitT/TauT family transport system substrate-binding protein